MSLVLSGVKWCWKLSEKYYERELMLSWESERELIRQAALSIGLICKIWNLIGRIIEAETRVSWRLREWEA